MPACTSYKTVTMTTTTTTTRAVVSPGPRRDWVRIVYSDAAYYLYPSITGEEGDLIYMVMVESAQGRKASDEEGPPESQPWARPEGESMTGGGGCSGGEEKGEMEVEVAGQLEQLEQRGGATERAATAAGAAAATKR